MFKDWSYYTERGVEVILSRIALDAKVLTVDGKTRMSLEKAKKAASVNHSSTCFKGNAFSKSDLARSMWLAQEKEEEEYM